MRRIIAYNRVSNLLDSGNVNPESIEETQNSWSIRIFANGSFLPSELEVDVTPRRLTRFQIAPDETLLVNGTRMKADKNGLLTIRKVRLEPEEIVSLQIKRML